MAAIPRLASSRTNRYLGGGGIHHDRCHHFCDELEEEADRRSQSRDADDRRSAFHHSLDSGTRDNNNPSFDYDGTSHDGRSNDDNATVHHPDNHRTFDGSRYDEPSDDEGAGHSSVDCHVVATD